MAKHLSALRGLAEALGSSCPTALGDGALRQARAHPRESARRGRLEAIVAWVKRRPTAATEHLLLSLPRTGEPRPLGSRDIARHAAAADLPRDA